MRVKKTSARRTMTVSVSSVVVRVERLVTLMECAVRVLQGIDERLKYLEGKARGR